jgi:hypothetical protein
MGEGEIEDLETKGLKDKGTKKDSVPTPGKTAVKLFFYRFIST